MWKKLNPHPAIYWILSWRRGPSTSPASCSLLCVPALSTTITINVPFGLKIPEFFQFFLGDEKAGLITGIDAGFGSLMPCFANWPRRFLSRSSA
jgi:hypothetical protein